MRLNKYIFILIFYISSTSFSISAEKTVFLDIDFVLNNSIFGKSIYSKLDELNKMNFDNLVKMEKELDKKKKSIDVSKNISTKENLEQQVILFNQEVKNFRSEKNKILKNFELKKKNEINNFLVRINPIIQEYMKDNSISIVLPKNQIFMGNVEMDITNDIIELVNKIVK
jgi:Skp family chaperone for outer membrane proteins